MQPGNAVQLAGVVLVVDDMGDHPSAQKDAAFIAAARTDIPALLEEVARLQAEIHRIKNPPMIDAVTGETKEERLRRSP